MNDKKLVEEIMSEVMKRLTKNSDPFKILVIGPMEPVIACKEGAFMSKTEIGLQSYQQVLITQLSPASLAALAYGSMAQTDDEIILKALLEEKKVAILEEGLIYKQYKKQNYNPLYAHYVACEKRLEQYGVQIIKSPYELFNFKTINFEQHSRIAEHKGLEKLQIAKQEKLNQAEGEIVDLSHTNLLRESDIFRIQEKTTIVVNKKCIITPLAQDRIHSYQLKIKRT